MHIPAQRKSAATQAESKPGTPQQPTGQWWHAPWLLGSGDVTEAKMALIYGIASTWPDMGHLLGDMGDRKLPPTGLMATKQGPPTLQLQGLLAVWYPN